MLSAFTARPIIELRQRDKSKIESILAYGDRLLVGLNTGSLRVYRVNDLNDEAGFPVKKAGQNDRPSSQPKAKLVELLREQEKFSKYKIEQLAIIKEANTLVSLSNSYVSVHDLQTYELQETLTKTKGASAFAVTSNIIKDASSGIPSIVSRLAVAVKRHLFLWSWHDSELSSETSELTLVTGIKTLIWASGTSLIAGLSSSYVLVQVETLNVTDIIGPGSIGGAPGQDGGRFGGVGVASMSYMGMGGMVPRPLATRLSEGELLLAKDINTLFIDINGTSLGRRQIPWSVAPEAIGYSYPFLLALQATKGTLEVRNPESLSLLQTIHLTGASHLHVPQPNVSLAHAGKGFLVSSDRCVWRMAALGYDVQIDELVENARLDEALSLLGMLEDALLKDKNGRLREIKMLKAQNLFDQHKYRASLSLFTEVFAPPERVIRLYPRIIAGDLSASFPEHDARDTNQDFIRNEVWKESFSGNENISSTKDPPPNVNEDAATQPTISAETAIKKAATGRDDIGSTKRQLSEENIASNQLEGKDLITATIELQGYLVDARTRLQRYLNPDGTVKESLSNTDSHTTGDKQAFETLLIPSDGNREDDREHRLRETARLVDTTLFRAFMFANPALAGPLFRRPNFCDASVVNAKLLETGRFNDLVDFFFGKGLHREALDLLKKFGQAEEENELAPQLHGPHRTVAYLQNLPAEMIDLILEFAEWPVRNDPNLGMEIFLADSENAETLPRLAVLDFLKTIDEKLELEYLDHVINELNDDSPDFHSRFIMVCLKGLKFKDAEGYDHSAWKNKLVEFLKSSRHYESWKILRELSRDDPDLYEARAIVLGNMQEHRQALDIYVFKLKDPGKAEEYCNQIYLAKSPSTATPVQLRRSPTSDTEDTAPSIYHQLLSLYLSPPPPYKPQWAPALNILAKHGSRLPASSTLDLIPEILPIKDLESYFSARIRSANTKVYEGRLVAGLRKTVDVESEAKLRLGDDRPGENGGRNRRVVITDERVCGVCHKRFGGSAIKVLPNNVVIHYGCSVR